MERGWIARGDAETRSSRTEPILFCVIPPTLRPLKSAHAGPLGWASRCGTSTNPIAWHDGVYRDWAAARWLCSYGTHSRAGDAVGLARCLVEKEPGALDGAGVGRTYTLLWFWCGRRNGNASRADTRRRGGGAWYGVGQSSRKHSPAAAGERRSHGFPRALSGALFLHRLASSGFNLDRPRRRLPASELFIQV